MGDLWRWRRQLVWRCWRVLLRLQDGHHRDALTGIAWGLAQNSPSFGERDAQLRARGMAPIQARVALARHACRLAYRLLRTQQPFDEQRYRQGRLSGER